jgi:hypothetical protein
MLFTLKRSRLRRIAIGGAQVVANFLVTGSDPSVTYYIPAAPGEVSELLFGFGHRVVAAVQAYSRITDNGRWIERTETVNLNELFERMTVEELESYAKLGTLPGWFPVAPVATGKDGQERANDD